MNNLITVKEAADLLGVSSKTIRRWENDGRITSMRTVGGHRRFSLTDLLSFKEAYSLIIGYARVTHESQREILEKQVQTLQNYCSKQGGKYEIIQDYGNSINSERPGLRRLLELLCSGRANSLVIPNHESLGRFYSNLIFRLCNLEQVQIVILNTVESAVEEEICEDLQEIIKVLQMNLCGLQSPKNLELMQYLKVLESLAVKTTSL